MCPPYSKEMDATVSAESKDHKLVNGLVQTGPETDPEETQEWIDSLDQLIEERGRDRASHILVSMLD